MSDTVNPYVNNPYWREVFAIRGRWEDGGLVGLVEAVAGALGAFDEERGDDVPYSDDERAATRAADEILTAIAKRWVILRRPSTVGDLLAAPAAVRAAAEVQP